MATARNRHVREGGMTDSGLVLAVEPTSDAFLLRLVGADVTGLPDGTVAEQALPRVTRERDAATAVARAAFIAANSTTIGPGLHPDSPATPYMETLAALTAQEEAAGLRGPMSLEQAIPDLAARGASLQVFPDAYVPDAVIAQAPIN